MTSKFLFCVSLLISKLIPLFRVEISLLQNILCCRLRNSFEMCGPYVLLKCNFFIIVRSIEDCLCNYS